MKKALFQGTSLETKELVTGTPICDDDGMWYIIPLESSIKNKGKLADGSDKLVCISTVVDPESICFVSVLD